MQLHVHLGMVWKGANQLANDYVKSVDQSKWLVEGKLSKDNTKEFQEFMFYMFQASEMTRRATLSLFIRPENNLVDFVSDLQTKLLEKKVAHQDWQQPL